MARELVNKYFYFKNIDIQNSLGFFFMVNFTNYLIITEKVF